MDDALYGKRNKRGDWAPNARITYAPLFDRPMRPAAIVAWFAGWPGYFLPWNAVFSGLAVLIWLFATPSLDTMRHFAPGWIALIFLRNALLVFAVTGAWHLALYIKKSQGKAFKYNGNWPSVGNSAFLFRNQNIDNIIWTFASGVPFWTAFEVVIWWCFANHYVPFVSWSEHPVYCVLIMLLIPAFREMHFYVIHRFIHWPPLYRTVHKLHHNNVNPGPWSGIAMHPIEHLLYFSGALIHLIVPSHPIHAMFHLFHAALTPAQGHVGFDRIVVGGDKGFDTHCYAHYLHHKYFECNYADGNIPLDRWFGTFHDGSPDGQAAMDARWAARVEKLNAKVAP